MKEAWKEMARVYDKLLPPNRPSKGDIQVFGRFIYPRLKPKVNILLLGSTPELRDLLHSACLAYNAGLTIVDLSKDMYGAMTLLMESRNPKEKFISKPWQDTGLESHSFDIIIGDEVIVNLPLKVRDKFFKEIIRILKPDGVFITRHNAVEPKDKELNKKAIVEELEKVIELKQTIGQALNNISETYLYHLAYKKDGQEVTTGDVLDESPDFLNAIKDDKKMLSIAEEILRRGEIFEATRDQTWIYNTREENERELKKYFKIIDQAHADDYITIENKIIYVLSPKNE